MGDDGFVEFTIPTRVKKNRGKPLSEIRDLPEFVPEWDVHRDADGMAVTIDFDCQYGHLPRALTDDELIAVRVAVMVHRRVCDAEGSEQHRQALDTHGQFLWRAPCASKSRLLGRMIHDGMPPTRTKPPVVAAEPRWDLLPAGDPFRAAPVPLGEIEPVLELLTADEHRAIELAGELAGLIARITASGPTHDADIAEMAADIHKIQWRVLAQAAGRAYPDRYRLLGTTLSPE